MLKNHSIMLSVIIPVFNNGEELRRAIASVLEQPEVKNGKITVEIIMVNDASSASCIALLENITESISETALYHHEKNQGPAAARNTGILLAKGELISFIDGDDEWASDKLRLLLPHLQDAATMVASGRIQYIFDEGIPKSDIQFETSDNLLSHVHLGASVVKRGVFDKGLFFESRFRFSEDVDWWLNLREHQLGIVIIEEPTLLYHVHGNNISVDKTPAELNLLSVLQESLHRRRSRKTAQALPQLNDFRRFQQPLVSIVIPLFNGKNFITRALNSIKNQSYSNWEVFVIDDGSSDEGADLVSDQYPSIQLMRQANSGQAVARNQGVKAAKGKYIAFLDQDDEWLPEKLALQVQALNHNPYVGFVTCNQSHYLEEGIKNVPANMLQALQGLKEVHRSMIPSALMVRKHALDKVGGFDAELRMGDDTDLLLKLRHAGYQELNVEHLLLRKWIHGSNDSFNTAKMKKGLFEVLYKNLKRKNEQHN